MMLVNQSDRRRARHQFRRRQFGRGAWVAGRFGSSDVSGGGHIVTEREYVNRSTLVRVTTHAVARSLDLNWALSRN